MLQIKIKDIKGRTDKCNISIMDGSHVLDSFTLPSTIARNIANGNDVNRDCMGWYEQRINAAVKNNDFEIVRAP